MAASSEGHAGRNHGSRPAYDVARKRLDKTGRQLDRFEREDAAFHERVRQAYRRLAQAEPARVRMIDASRDFESVKKSVQEALKGL